MGGDRRGLGWGRDGVGRAQEGTEGTGMDGGQGQGWWGKGRWGPGGMEKQEGMDGDRRMEEREARWGAVHEATGYPLLHNQQGSTCWGNSCGRAVTAEGRRPGCCGNLHHGAPKHQAAGPMDYSGGSDIWPRAPSPLHGARG